MIYWMRPRPAPWRKAVTAWTVAAGAFAFLADVRPALTQTPLDLYLERVAMTAAGAQCRLFDADLTTALAVGVGQARTSALRAGYTDSALDRSAAEARALVGGMTCQSARVQQAAQRTREAFRAYSGLQRMSFPGDVGAWRADRSMPVHSAAWRLAQSAYAGQDRVVFGVAGREGAEAVTLSVASVDGAEPYAARLVVRDPTRMPQPLLKAGNAPLSDRTPVRAGARVILAVARADADPALRPLGASKAVAFRFPADTEQALEQLDPREAVSVELLYPSERGDLVHTAFLEIGDFDSGLAFLKNPVR